MGYLADEDPEYFLDINTPRRFQGRNKILFGHRDSHSFTTSATNGFDHHWKTDSLSLRHQSRVVLRLPVISLQYNEKDNSQMADKKTPRRNRK